MLSPILIPVVVLLKLTGEGEVFYTQKRVGRGKKEFELYKFATMMKNSEQLGAGTVTLKDDFRVRPSAKFSAKQNKRITAVI